ncbi:beta-galactosidase [Streptosporangium canum]|uniref:beta-galactosidase n=1 Tax=Streptosporangium canum TaxID=324952 RepID=UPI003698FB6F
MGTRRPGSFHHRTDRTGLRPSHPAVIRSPTRVRWARGADAHDLLAIVRPGPYICVEWHNGGLLSFPSPAPGPPPCRSPGGLRLPGPPP